MLEKRPYKMRKRAESHEQTRLRIVEATMQLHEEIGPRNTTISAIAERAGVQRLTVYRHFPDETAVFQACTSHWQALNPPPDPAEWRMITEPMARLHTCLLAFYNYYGKTQAMWAVAFRDVGEVGALQQPMAEVRRFMSEVGDDLIAAFASPGDHLAPTVRHVLQFQTWQDLEQQGLSNTDKVALALAWTQCSEGRNRSIEAAQIG